jgi:hypothetical protein
MVSPAVGEQLQHPGFDSRTENAIMGEGMGTATAAFDAADQNASNRVARTRNPAGYAELAGRLARDKATATSDAARKGRITVASNRQDQQQQGIENATNLYGIDSETMRALYDLGPSTLGARAAGPSVYSGLSAAGDFMSGIGSLGIKKK